MEISILNSFLQFIYQQSVCIVSATILMTLLYKYYTKSFDYFETLDIPYMKPTFMLGNIGPLILSNTSFAEWDISLYTYFEGLPYGGVFLGRSPQIMIRDPELIKKVLIKDFEHFTDRSQTYINPTLHIKNNLVNYKGEEWRNLRKILSPVFTSGKLRAMENILQQCGKQMVELLGIMSDHINEIEMKEFSSRFTLEVIARTAFGLDCKSLENSKAEFVNLAEKFVQPSKFQQFAVRFLVVLCPELLQYLPVATVNLDCLRQLYIILKKSISDRKSGVTERNNDFLQNLIDISDKEMKENPENILLNKDAVEGQVMLFLLAGFESSSTLISFICFTLASRQDLQDKLRYDILENVKKYGEDCTYDSLKEIFFLDKIILETMRVYPPVTRTDRVCTKKYTIPGTHVTLNVGDNIIIPIGGILQDLKYYPEPHIFNPDRFSGLKNHLSSDELYMVFGLGPRNCIGMRFAMNSIKTFIFYLIKNYKLLPSSKNMGPIQYKTGTLFLTMKNGAWNKIESLKK